MNNSEKFECLRCGNCCRWHGYVVLDGHETEQIAQFLNMDTGQFTGQYCQLTANRQALSLIEDETTGYCIFFRENPARCLIQAVKPAQCSKFPRSWQTKTACDECEGLKALEQKTTSRLSQKKTRGKS